MRYELLQKKGRRNILRIKISKLSSQKKLALFVLIFGLIGASTLLITRAATPTAQFEAESASRTGSASIVADSTASGGNAVAFGSVSSSVCSDGPLFTSHQICVNQSSIQTSSTGYNVPLISSYNYSKLPVCFNGEVAGCKDNAAFRTDCGYSHTSKNDAIVFPGQKDAAHWHTFFGNTAADENLTTPGSTGNSTCQGGTLNRTAYWAPALIDTNSYNSTTKNFNLAQVMKPNDTGVASDPDVRGAQGLQIYYKAGYQGAIPRNIEWYPVGLRMITGANPNIAPTGPVRVSAPFNSQHRSVFFDCIKNGNTQSRWGTQGIDWEIETIPVNCPAGYYIQARIEFPQCGANNPDGTPMLDSPNHRSHMSFARGWPDLGCPSTHPRTYPQITEHFRWKVPATGASGLKFSSDIYPGAQAGWTFHADWFNGWDVQTSQTLVNNCYKGGVAGLNLGFDCQVDLLGTPHSSGVGFTALGYNDNR